MKKYEGKIADNYQKYLEEPFKIGFTKEFPVKDVIDTIEITSKCRTYDVTFKINYCNVTFGNEKFTCKAIITERVDIGSKLPMGGFASHSYIDESKTMELAVVEMAKKHDLMICNKINSWPFAKAIVSDNHFLN